ncbi:MAG: biotin carboxylase, partial [Sulfitobacter sp.]
MITSVSDARLFFHRNEQPIYFVSASPFNLLGIDTWVSNFKFINLIDCFDGRHPNVIVPTRDTLQEFESMEEINNHLLGNKEVLEYIRSKKRGQGVFLMFDDETEKLAKAAKLRIPFPRAKLRNKLDDKIETVKIGERAGVPSVPNVLARVTSYEDLCQKAESLGTDLVIQTAFGDSGHTTFFVSSKATWKKYADEITSAGTVKIMKRIKCRQAAIEACTTRCGTVVGPLMTEIVGFKELTPYRGGWAGNEISPNAFPLEISERARDLTFKFGEELHKTGYRGYFELDFLI